MVSDIYTVLRIDGDNTICDRRETHEQKTFRLDEIVVSNRLFLYVILNAMFLTEENDLRCTFVIKILVFLIGTGSMRL